MTIEQVGVEQFRTLLLEMSRDDPKASGSDAESGLLVGFNFIPPPEKRVAVPLLEEVLAEQVVGFYAKERDRVYVPRVPLTSDDQAVEQRGVVAHEIHHALQAQHFSLPELDSLPTDDARLAQLALVEGDAMVAMAAYLGTYHGAPIHRVVRRLTDVTKRVSLNAVTHRLHGDEKLKQALPLLQERLQFPYIAGMTFVADVYRAGGFDLVNEMYSHPPRSTAQILHPQKYLDGIMPVELPEPAPPSGFRTITTGTLGELQLRILLASCTDRQSANRAAAGWSGDRYTVVANAAGELGVLWSTAWDRDEDAQQFDLVVSRHPSCWAANAGSSASGGGTISATHRARREGTRVAFVRGLDDAHIEAALRSLLEGSAQPNIGKTWDLKLPKREPLPEHQFGRVKNGAYRNKWLALRGTVPPGYGFSIGVDSTELFVKRADSGAIGAFVVSDRMVSPKYDRKAFRDVAQAFANAVGAGSLRRAELERPRLPLGRASSQTWHAAGSRLEMRTVLVPMCAGTGSLVFVQAWTDRLGRFELDQWLESFRWTKDSGKPVCAMLDPK